jgi:hypothetical protein
MDDNKSKSWKDKLGDLLFEEDQTSEDATAAIPTSGITDDSAVSSAPTEFTAAIPGTAAMPGEGLDLAAIYRNAGIQDEQFATPEQVLDLKRTFADLPAEVQKQKVLKTLTSFKVDAAKVSDNTLRKIAAIEKYVSSVRAEGTTTIDTSNQTIEELQKQVDACKKRIIETQTLLDSVSRESQSAIAELRAVLDFLGVTASPALPTTEGKTKPPKNR